jgi:hypothetical protein
LREFSDPTIDTRVIDVHVALCHHLLQISVVERIGQISVDTDQDDVLFKSVSFKINHESNLRGIGSTIAYRKQRSLLTQQNHSPTTETI